MWLIGLKCCELISIFKPSSHRTLMNRLLFIFFSIATGCQQPAVETLSDAGADSIVNMMRRDIGFSIRTGEQRHNFAYLDSIRPLVDSLRHYGVTSTWHRIRGMAEMMIYDYSNAARSFETATILARQQDTTNKFYGAALSQFGHFEGLRGNYDTALVLLQQALPIGLRTDDSNTVALSCLGLSKCLELMHDTAGEHRYLFLGLRYANAQVYKEYFVHNILVYYRKGAMNDSAKIFTQRILQDSLRFNVYTPAERAEVLGAMMADQELYEKARHYMADALTFRRAVGELTAGIYFNLGNVNMQLKNYRVASAYLDTALLLARVEGDPAVLARIFSARAQLQHSHQHWVQVVQSMDSFYFYHQREDSASRQADAMEIDTRFRVRETKLELAEANVQRMYMAAEVRRRNNLIILGLLLVVGGAYIAWRRYRRSRRKSEAREKMLIDQMLRSRMEPHFIFNSLGVLHGFIQAGETEKAKAYIGSFSRLAKISLDNSRQGWVPLADEIEALEAYLSIQSKNYARMSYDISVFEGYRQDELEVPTMLIQPFVENAVIHGVAAMSEPCHIRVSIRRGDGVLHCVIEDNGPGLRHRMQAPGKTSESTQITEARLDILKWETGRDTSLSIRDKKQVQGRGVLVALDLPYR
ncbi:sensor histidine kinase [Chitinophaga barathri]|nr:histidine kinase [Chitinophaga barathri]